MALKRFGHAPTPSQERALAEIDADLAAPRRMLRLLQGDVGSGKTLVALLAMLRAAEAGRQAALMAPTEVLARQHHRVLGRLSPVPVGLLTGSVKGIDRRRVLNGLASGRLQLVVGTHALFQDAVEYRDLALAVIDEQHRFGVAQRMTLGRKGMRTDVLVMTATPIRAHPAADAMGRDGGEPPHRKTCRAAADPHHNPLAGHPGRRGGRHRPRPGPGGARVLGLPDGERERNDGPGRRGGPLRPPGNPVRATRVALAHGQMDPERRDRALAGFADGSRAGCWWRPP